MKKNNMQVIPIENTIREQVSFSLIQYFQEISILPR